MIIGGTCDMFDGRVARKTGQTTKSGAFYDSVMDRFGEAVVLFGLALYYHDSWVLYLVISALIGSMMVSYTRAKGDSVGVDCKGGIMQRPERIVYLGVGSIFSPPFRQLVDPHAAQPVEYLTIAALAVIAVMTLLTSVYRMIYIFRKLSILDGKKPKESNSPILKKLTHRYLDS
jgi:CDP-diacylglycerol--glycerol-3-phosphate 3-phosphatidyltransferase